VSIVLSFIFPEQQEDVILSNVTYLSSSDSGSK